MKRDLGKWSASLARRAVIAMACAAAGVSASAQWAPERPVRVVVPFVAGASYDTIMRIIGEPLGDALKQQIVVDNRAGANGVIGADLVARATPDGHTLALLGDNHAILPAIGRKTPYDLFTDFAPVMRVAKLDNVVVTHASVPAQTLKELVALFKAHPGKYRFGSGGTAGTTHLAGERFALMAGVQILHVPYKGGGLAVTGMLSNEVQLMVANMISVKPHAHSGRLRAYAVAAPERSAHLPNVPSTAEAGLPGLEVTQFYALLAPARTPQRVIARFEKELVPILQSAGVRKRVEAQGGDVVSGTPAGLAAFLKQEVAAYRKTAQAAGIKGE